MSTAKKRKASSLKDDTIHIRANPRDKELIQKAADTLGLNVSSFILEHALRAARKELATVDAISLGSRDAERFFSLLMNPPSPNAALTKAMSEHKKRVQR